MRLLQANEFFLFRGNTVHRQCVFFCFLASFCVIGTDDVYRKVITSVVRHVTGNDKDYLRLIPRVVW